MRSELVIAKRHVNGRLYEAVVMERDTNRIVWASGLGWNKSGKQACSSWIGVETRTPR